MYEIDKLVKSFDSKITLSNNKLYEKFGLNNGEHLLRKYFESISLKMYDDYLDVTESEPLIEYILSCHGNQNEYILVSIRNLNQT